MKIMHLWLHLDVKICQKVLAEIDMGIYILLSNVWSLYLLFLFKQSLLQIDPSDAKSKSIYSFLFPLFFAFDEKDSSPERSGVQGTVCEKKKYYSFLDIRLLITIFEYRTLPFVPFVSELPLRWGSF